MNRIVAMGLVGAVWACGGEDVSTPAPVNLPPAWEGAPQVVAVGQGQELRVPLAPSDPEGDEVTVTATSDTPGLSAEVADGELRLHAGYDLAGSAAVTVTLADAQDSVDVPLAVEVKPLAWVAHLEWGAEGPQAREHGAMAVANGGPGSHSTRVLLFGGSGYMPYLDPLDDAWSLDPKSGTWSQLATEGTPSGGGSRRVALVPDDGAYLFGGYGVNGKSNNELWRMRRTAEGLTFDSVPQENTPTARALHAFVYDQATSSFWMFGGAGNAPRGDTWRMKLAGGTAVWEEVPIDPAPSPRYGFFYGFDAERGRLLLFSGAQGTASIDAARDTWVLDVRAEPPSWTLLAEGEAVPPGRRNGCMVFDPTGPRLFVFGGTADAKTTEPGLHVLDARPGHEAWTTLVLEGEPKLRSSGFGFFEAETGRSWLGFGNTTSAVFRDQHALGYAP